LKINLSITPNFLKVLFKYQFCTLLAGNPLPNYVPIGISNQVIACLLACFCLKPFFNLFHIRELPANRLFLGKKLGSWDLGLSFSIWDRWSYIFFFDLRGCPGQLARTTTNPTAHWTPCKPSEHVRHRGGDRCAHEDSNPGVVEGDKPLPPPGQDPRCDDLIFWI